MQRLETYLQTYLERTGVRMTENICKLFNGKLWYMNMKYIYVYKYTNKYLCLYIIYIYICIL